MYSDYILSHALSVLARQRREADPRKLRRAWVESPARTERVMDDVAACFRSLVFECPQLLHIRLVRRFIVIVLEVLSRARRAGDTLESIEIDALFQLKRCECIDLRA